MTDTNIKKLLALDVKLAAKCAEIEAAERAHIRPLNAQLKSIGDEANAVWLRVLADYGPGAAQDALHEARNAAFNAALDKQETEQ